jgi:hypothetical protein
MMKAMKKRKASGISAPNRVSNIAPPCAPGDVALVIPNPETVSGCAEWLTPVGNTCRHEY